MMWFVDAEDLSIGSSSSPIRFCRLKNRLEMSSVIIE